MADKTAAEKMRLKPGLAVTALFDEVRVASRLGADPSVNFDAQPADADAVLLFVTTQVELEERLAPLLPLLRPSTLFWIVYPKGSRAAGRDISRDTIWSVVEPLGLRPIGMVSIDETWSGFRLRPQP